MAFYIESDGTPIEIINSSGNIANTARGFQHIDVLEPWPDTVDGSGYGNSNQTGVGNTGKAKIYNHNYWSFYEDADWYHPHSFTRRAKINDNSKTFNVGRGRDLIYQQQYGSTSTVKLYSLSPTYSYNKEPSKNYDAIEFQVRMKNVAGDPSTAALAGLQLGSSANGTRQTSGDYRYILNYYSRTNNRNVISSTTGTEIQLSPISFDTNTHGADNFSITMDVMIYRPRSSSFQTVIKWQGCSSALGSYSSGRGQSIFQGWARCTHTEAHDYLRWRLTNSSYVEGLQSGHGTGINY